MTTSIDWQECLRLSNNKADLAKELLDMLEKDLPQSQININKAFQDDDIRALQEHTHKLHGACCYCGVPRLRELIEQLETCIKTNKNDQIANLVAQVDREIEKVLTTLKQNKHA